MKPSTCFSQRAWKVIETAINILPMTARFGAIAAASRCHTDIAVLIMLAELPERVDSAGTHANQQTDAAAPEGSGPDSAMPDPRPDTTFEEAISGI